MTLRLKRSKTDKDHNGTTITIAATNDDLCPVAAMRRLFEDDPQPPHAPLFTWGGKAFTASKVRKLLDQRVKAAGFTNQFTGHSFRKGAAQQAMNNGMSDQDIQRLGRWDSDAYKLVLLNLICRSIPPQHSLSNRHSVSLHNTTRYTRYPSTSTTLISGYGHITASQLISGHFGE
jgi:hypothetical protein